MSKYYCRIHDGETFNEIPGGAVELGTKLLRFSDGTVHELRSVASKEKQSFRGRWSAHVRFHLGRNVKKSECEFCNSPAQEELLKEVKATLEELPVQAVAERDSPGTAVEQVFNLSIQGELKDMPQVLEPVAEPTDTEEGPTGHSTSL